MHIAHELRFARGSGGTTHTLTDGDANAGRLALEGSEDQFRRRRIARARADQIKTRPVQIGQRVINQRRCVGEIGGQIALTLEQAREAGGKFRVATCLVGEVEGGVYRFVRHQACSVVKVMTSRICSAPLATISKRSNPTATPADGGKP